MRALVIGGSSWDTLLHVPDINQVTGDLVLWANKVIKTVGGTGAGKALALSALGVEVTLLTPLGKDEYRQKILDYFKKTEIKVIEVEANETTTHTNLMHSKGKRISVFTSLAKKAKFYPEIAKLIDKSDVIFLNINPYCRDYVQILKDTNKPILVDIHDYDEGNTYHDDFIDVGDIIVASATHIENQKAFLEKMIEKGKHLVVVTNSSKGLYALDNNSNYYTIDGYNDFEFVDSNGAGDSFCAGLMTSYFESNNYGEALKFANVCGGIACTSEDLFNMNYNKEMIEYLVQKKKS